MKNPNWELLSSESQLNDLIQKSNEKTIVIFKHSRRCGISSHAEYKLESEWDFSDSELDFYYLDLLKYRSISNTIAEKFDVIHQSPQIIIIKNGIAENSFSHQAISVSKIREKI